MSFDIQETTVQIDHTNKLVSFYTTKRSVFLGLLKRNPSYTSAAELNPGYEVSYPLDQLRAAPMILRSAEGSADDQFLTPKEREARAAAGQRLKARRRKGAA